MSTLYSATNAYNAFSTSAGEISVYVVAAFAVLAGAQIAIRWFKRGVGGISKGRVK